MSSDSSMDDCNYITREPACPTVLGSDSSMDDCNNGDDDTRKVRFVFRFLYGRL